MFCHAKSFCYFYFYFFLQGVTYFTALIAFNPTVKPRLQDTFGPRRNIYRHIFTHLFRPTDSILSRVIAFRREHQFHRKLVIGMHLRTGGDFRDDMPHSDWLHYLECAQMMTRRVWAQRSLSLPVVYFVAADTAQARTRALNLFGRSNLSNVEVLFYGDYMVSNNAPGVQSAFIDMLLVTGADARVLTPGSSYSEFAWSMAHDDNDVLRNSVFVKSSTSTGPRLCYEDVEVLDKAHPYCVRPCSLDPSTEDLNKMLTFTRSQCKLATNISSLLHMCSNNSHLVVMNDTTFHYR